MKNIFWLITITNILYVSVLFIYLVIVHLNLVFTFDHLSVGDVPYYSGGVSYSSGAERFLGLDFWVYASDYLLFIPVFSTTASIASSIIYPKGPELFNIGSIAVILIIQVLKLAYRVIEWGFCSSYNQFCRPFNPATPTSSFGNTNFVFEWTVFFTLATIPVLLVYLFLSTQITQGKKDFYLNLSRNEDIRIVDGPTEGFINNFYREFKDSVIQSASSMVKTYASKSAFGD